MTNEEKAKEFAEIFSGNEVTQKGVQFWLMKMAEWKDQQFREYLERKKAAIHFRSDWIGYHSAICTELIEEIINELFPMIKTNDIENDE